MNDDFSYEDIVNECITIAEGFCEAVENDSLIAAQMLYDILVANEWENAIEGQRYRDAMRKYNHVFRSEESY